MGLLAQLQPGTLLLLLLSSRVITFHHFSSLVHHIWTLITSHHFCHFFGILQILRKGLWGPRRAGPRLSSSLHFFVTGHSFSSLVITVYHLSSLCSSLLNTVHHFSLLLVTLHSQKKKRPLGGKARGPPPLLFPALFSTCHHLSSLFITFHNFSSLLITCHHLPTRSAVLKYGGVLQMPNIILLNPNSNAPLFSTSRTTRRFHI